MLSNVSPNRPDHRETAAPPKLKPNEPPRNDSFRKAYKEGRPPKEEEEELAATEEKEDSQPPSLFDLSKKGSTKSKSSFSKSSTLKDSSDAVSNRPIISKREADQESGFLANGGEAEADSDIPQKPVDDHLFAAGEKPLVPEDSQQMKAPQQEVEEPLVPEDSQQMEAPQQEMEATSSPEGMETAPQEEVPQPQQMPGDIKKPKDQARLAEIATRQQGATLQQLPKARKSEEASFESKELGQVSKKDKSKGEAKSTTSTADQEKAGVAAVNSSIQSVGFQAEKAEEVQETARSATIKDLANQIIDRIQIMRRDNETSTMITLRHPPILQGATITLTTSDHAKKEFNISFANLTPDAKLFLDRKLNEDSLTQTLERKGIIVHMVSTTTQPENLLNIDAAGQAFRDRQEQQQQQQQQRRQQQFENEEET
jgi:hypothetical protein